MIANGGEVAGELAAELSERTELAGVDVLQARIVDGAVGMVGLALEKL